MKGYFVKLVITGFLFGIISVCDAQVIAEDDVSFEVLKWHFNHYPNSESQGWYQMSEVTLRASFAFEGENYNVVYTSSGTRLSEELDMTKSVPLSVVYYLDDKYGKYKVQEFKRITNFNDEQIYYIMDVKSKDKGEERLSFDEHLIPVDFALVSSID